MSLEHEIQAVIGRAGSQREKLRRRINCEISDPAPMSVVTDHDARHDAPSALGHEKPLRIHARLSRTVCPWIGPGPSQFTRVRKREGAVLCGGAVGPMRDGMAPRPPP